MTNQGKLLSLKNVTKTRYLLIQVFLRFSLNDNEVFLFASLRITTKLFIFTFLRIKDSSIFDSNPRIIIIFCVYIRKILIA